ncbi:HAD family hydrolase [Planctomicrobium piriforme]|uniref:Sugar-phosphatase n=1 Tax=Planctomicrobium piriforme TaxID=1576369 RepID=A0A1I3Q375_9PLAN|nr:HAD family hydrolase [Planctomicrobium piriforme]SFJ27606.1 sugar-phosphatase [Planctomicrobium piriforme]
MHTCSALIFDLDGVLVDSNSTSEKHWELWANQHGLPYEQIAKIHHGRPTIEIIRTVAPHLDAVAEARLKEDAEADDTEGMTAFPGAARLLTTLPKNRWAIVTSGKRRTATIRLNFVKLPIPEIFVTSNDITRGKPDPEPYAQAITRLGFSAEKCVVLEDAPAGIESGLAAGAFVIGLATTNDPKALSAAHVVLKHLDDLKLTVTQDGLQLTWDSAASIQDHR